MNFWWGFLNVKIQNYSSGKTDSLGPSLTSDIVIRTGSSCFAQLLSETAASWQKLYLGDNGKIFGFLKWKPVLFHSERWSNCNALHLGNQIILVNAAFHDSKKFENTFQYSPFDLLTNEITSVSRKLKINVINSTSQSVWKKPQFIAVPEFKKEILAGEAMTTAIEDGSASSDSPRVNIESPRWDQKTVRKAKTFFLKSKNNMSISVLGPSHSFLQCNQSIEPV